MKTNLILVSIIILLTIACYFVLDFGLKEKKERIRANNNLINEINAKNEAYTQINIKTKEIALIKPKLDSVIKANKLRPKQVQKVITYETRIKWDTIRFIQRPPIADETNRLITVAGIDNCFTAEGIIDLTNTKLLPTDDDVSNMMFTLFNTKVVDNGGVIYYSARDTTKRYQRILPFWPFAKKKFYSKGYSECGSKVEIQEINIIKK